MRIGVTQRVEVVASYGERRDCLDQHWSAFLESVGLVAVPVPNSLDTPGRWLDELGIEGLLLTGGNDLSTLPDAANPAPERDRTEVQLLSLARERTLPVLGVCRGMQMMNHWLGGELVPVTGHTAVRHTLTMATPAPDWSVQDQVNSFHNWGMVPSGLAGGLDARYLASDGTVEACTHSVLPWVGIMWHPEREAPFSGTDQQLFRRIFKERL